MNMDFYMSEEEQENSNSDDLANDLALSSSEGDLDLFTDLLDADYAVEVERVEEVAQERDTLVAENADLKKLNAEMSAEISSVRKENAILKKNISALFKTAKADISRKDALIAKLREEMDSLIFRRRKHIMETRDFGSRGNSGCIEETVHPAAIGEGPNDRNELKTSNQNAPPTKEDHPGPNLVPSPKDGTKSISQQTGDTFSSVSPLGNARKHCMGRETGRGEVFHDRGELPRLRCAPRESHRRGTGVRRGTGDLVESGGMTQSDPESPACPDFDRSTRKTRGMRRGERSVPAEDEGGGDYDQHHDYCKVPNTYVDVDRRNNDLSDTPRNNLITRKIQKRNNFRGQRASTPMENQAESKDVAHPPEKFPEALKSDSLKLYSYHGTSVPFVVKKRVLGYAKSPLKATRASRSVKKHFSPGTSTAQS